MTIKDKLHTYYWEERSELVLELEFLGQCQYISWWSGSTSEDVPNCCTFSCDLYLCVLLAPFFAATGTVSVHQSKWESEFNAIATEMLARNWLKYWIEAGAVLSAIGLCEALYGYDSVDSSWKYVDTLKLCFSPFVLENKEAWREGYCCIPETTTLRRGSINRTYWNDAFWFMGSESVFRWDKNCTR